MWTVKVAIMVRSIIRAVSTCDPGDPVPDQCGTVQAPFAFGKAGLRVIASFSEEGHPHLTRCSAVLAPCRVPRYQGPKGKDHHKTEGIKGPVLVQTRIVKGIQIACVAVDPVLWTRWPRGRVQDCIEDAPPRTCCSQVRTAPPGGAAGRSRFEGEYLNNGLDRKTAAAPARALMWETM